MQLHLDCSVPDVLSLQQVLQTALGLGAALRLDRSEDPDEPLYVLTDPAGHPFCVFVEERRLARRWIAVDGVTARTAALGTEDQGGTAVGARTALRRPVVTPVGPLCSTT